MFSTQIHMHVYPKSRPIPMNCANSDKKIHDGPRTRGGKIHEKARTMFTGGLKKTEGVWINKIVDYVVFETIAKIQCLCFVCFAILLL